MSYSMRRVVVPASIKMRNTVVGTLSRYKFPRLFECSYILFFGVLVAQPLWANEVHELEIPTTDVPIVDALEASKMNADSSIESGNCAEAVQHIDLFLDSSAVVTSVLYRGLTPLLKQSEEDRQKIVRQLLRDGVDIIAAEDFLKEISQKALEYRIVKVECLWELGDEDAAFLGASEIMNDVDPIDNSAQWTRLKNLLWDYIGYDSEYYSFSESGIPSGEELRRMIDRADLEAVQKAQLLSLLNRSAGEIIGRRNVFRELESHGVIDNNE